MKKILYLIIILCLFFAVTCYDVQAYSEDETASENDITVSATSDDSSDSDETDTSSSIEMNVNVSSDAVLTLYKAGDYETYGFTISGLTYNSEYLYYFCVSDGSYVPDLIDGDTLNFDGRLSYDSTENVFYYDDIDKYLELAAEYYVYVYEYYYDSESKSYVATLIADGLALEKPEQKQYTDVFTNTYIAWSNTQIVFNVPWEFDTVRKIHLRIGTISDDTILEDIYNGTSDAFANLLTYGQTATAFYDNTLNSTSCRSIRLDGELFSISNLVDDEYYFLYALVEDEDGTYVKTEGVSLARASVFSDDNKWYLLFYGSDDFSWKEFSSTTTETTSETTTTEDTSTTTETTTTTATDDSTTSTTVLPYTGKEKMLLIILASTVILGIFFYVKYNKYKEV